MVIFVVLVGLCAALCVMTIQLTRQINKVADSTKNVIMKVDHSTTIYRRVVSSILIIKSLVGRINRSKRQSKEDKYNGKK